MDRTRAAVPWAPAPAGYTPRVRKDATDRSSHRNAATLLPGSLMTLRDVASAMATSATVARVRLVPMRPGRGLGTGWGAAGDLAGAGLALGDGCWGFMDARTHAHAGARRKWTRWGAALECAYVRKCVCLRVPRPPLQAHTPRCRTHAPVHRACVHHVREVQPCRRCCRRCLRPPKACATCRSRYATPVAPVRSRQAYAGIGA